MEVKSQRGLQATQLVIQCSKLKTSEELCKKNLPKVLIVAKNLLGRSTSHYRPLKLPQECLQWLILGQIWLLFCCRLICQSFSDHCWKLVFSPNLDSKKLKKSLLRLERSMLFILTLISLKFCLHYM